MTIMSTEERTRRISAAIWARATERTLARLAPTHPFRQAIEEELARLLAVAKGDQS